MVWVSLNVFAFVFFCLRNVFACFVCDRLCGVVCVVVCLFICVCVVVGK